MLSFYILKNELLKLYPSKRFLLTQILTILATLFVYKLTSNAIGSSLSSQLDWYGLDYFDFLVLGEAFVLLPSLFFEYFSKSIKDGIHRSFLFRNRFNKSSSLHYHLLQSLGLASREIIGLLLLLILANIFFSLSTSIIFYINLILSSLIILPTFLGLGILSGSIVTYFGRGEGIISQLTYAGIVFSGALFPVGVFPKWLQDVLILNPFTIYLNTMRDTYQSGAYFFQDTFFLQYFLSSGSILLPLSILCFLFVSKKIKKENYQHTIAMY